MTKTKNVAAVQGTSAHTQTPSVTPSVTELAAQFGEVKELLKQLLAVKEPVKVEPIAVKEPAKSKGKKAQTRKEGLADWKSEKEKKATETVTASAIFQVTDRGFFLVGNIAELDKIRMSDEKLQKYLVYVKRKSINGKVYDGYSFSIKRVETIKQAFSIK